MCLMKTPEPPVRTFPIEQEDSNFGLTTNAMQANTIQQAGIL